MLSYLKFKISCLSAQMLKSSSVYIKAKSIWFRSVGFNWFINKFKKKLKLEVESSKYEILEFLKTTEKSVAKKKKNL